MINNPKRSGMAVLIVLTFATMLLILAGAYLSSFSKQSSQNSIELGAVQADLLSEGIAQIAMLKLKELPAPFYYSVLCKNAPEGGDEPFDVFCGDQSFNGKTESSSDGFTANYSTTIQCLPTQLYKNVNAKITVALSLTRSDKRTYERIIEKVVTGDRKLAE